MDRMTARWVAFSKVKAYPVDTNEILNEVSNEFGLDSVYLVSNQLEQLIDDELVIVHADDGHSILEVRLADVA